MTWSAFFAACRTGVQTRMQGMRQGVNRATQQSTAAQRPAQRAAVSTQAAKKVQQEDEFDFLVMDVSYPRSLCMRDETFPLCAR